MKFAIEDHGTIVTFTPLDDGAREWLDDNVHAEPWQWQGETLAVDHRCAQPIRDAIAIEQDCETVT